MPVNPSRYRKTVRITRNAQTYLGPRVTRAYPPSGDDQFYKVEAFDTLPKIATRFFGNPILWWVIADFNDIIDPFVELVAGTTLRLPSKARLWMEVLA